MKRWKIGLVVVAASAMASACGGNSNAPLMPSGARFDNGGSLGGGGKASGGTMTAAGDTSTSLNGGSLGGGGR